MRNVPVPGRSAAVDLDTIISRSRNPNKALLQARRQDLLDLFASYVDDKRWDISRKSAPTGLPDQVESAMLRSYALTYSGRPLSRLREELLGVDDDLCPYCRLEKPTTLDHYLPKSRNKSFASFASNLVPMCATCNTYKGTKGSAKGLQFFTHAYFDELAGDYPFLVAQVAVGKRFIATNFTIDFSSGLDSHIYQRLAFQMSVLRLVPRYQLAAVDVICEQAEKLEEMRIYGCTHEDMRLSLSGDAYAEAGNFGENYWKAALLKALACNAAFYEGGYVTSLPAA